MIIGLYLFHWYNIFLCTIKQIGSQSRVVYQISDQYCLKLELIHTGDPFLLIATSFAEVY